MNLRLLVEAFDDENPDDVVWDNSLDFLENVKLLWQKITRYADNDIVQPIIWGYSILPQPCIKVAPVLGFCGLSGVGKTDSLRGMRIVRGLDPTSIVNEQSSPKSLRNQILSQRFVSADKGINFKDWDERLNYALLLDNMGSRFFKDDYNRSIWLGGNTRSTDIITVASPEGGNIFYPTFGLKVYSSVCVNDDPEVERRLLTVFCQKCNDEDFNPLSLEGSEESWSYHFNDFWQRSTCLEFLELRREYMKNKPKIDKNRLQQFREIYAALRIMDYSVKDAKKVIEAFENERTASLEIFNPLKEVITGILADLSNPQTIRVRTFSGMLSNKEDELLERPKSSEILDIMFSLGYVQGKVGSNLVWKLRNK